MIEHGVYDLTQTGQEVQNILDKGEALPTNQQLQKAFASKQDKLTFDNVPTPGSDNAITSGAVYDATTEEYEGPVTELPDASAETLHKIYLVGEEGATTYDRYYTSFDGTTYSWVPMGSTQINISGKTDKLGSGHANNVATFNSDGNLKDSSIAVADVESSIVYDISRANSVGDVLAEYADLSAALGVDGANIPENLRRGGMSVKFVQSSDNMYVQARLMANSFTTDVNKWQMIDKEPTLGSHNLVESGGVKELFDSQYADTTSDFAFSDPNGNLLSKYVGGHIKTKNFDSAKTTIIGEEENDSDLEIADLDGNVLLRLKDGHIITKNFNSAKPIYQVVKKAVFMGDSITHGVYSYWDNGIHDDNHRYNAFDLDANFANQTNEQIIAAATAYHGIPYFFGKLMNCETVNLARRGSGFVVDGRNGGNFIDLILGNQNKTLGGITAYNFSNVDLVVVSLGINDYIQGANIGDVADFVANQNYVQGTVIGNLIIGIKRILSQNPLCKIVIYSPYNSWGQVSKGDVSKGGYIANPAVFYGDESTNYALGAGAAGSTLQTYIDAIDTVCSYYGIQHVPLSKSNVCNNITLKNIMIDGLHPTKESYIKLAGEIFGKCNFGD